MKSLTTTLAVGAIAVSGLACANVPSAVASDTVYVKDYGTNVQAAFNAAAGKILVFPKGVVYSVSKPITSPSDITVQGNSSVLQTPKNSTRSTTSDELLLIKNQSNVNVSGLVFDGNVNNQNQWSQWRHGVVVAGTSTNVDLSSNTYKDPIGDGVYIGQGHPQDVHVSDSVFNGSHKNRNGVSIIAGTDISVTDNKFNSMARTDMPGAVDIEPNSSSDVLKNILVSNNTVTGGSKLVDKLQYGITFNNHADALADTVTVSGNNVSGGFYTGAGVIWINQSTPSRGINLKADGNVVHDLDAKATGVELDYGVKAAAINNTISNTGWGIQSWHACLTDSSGNTFNNTPNGGVVESFSTC